eukprot:scaffold12578_cov30-Tisochrysis_lutea.AAC.6
MATRGEGGGERRPLHDPTVLTIVVIMIQPYATRVADCISLFVAFSLSAAREHKLPVLLVILIAHGRRRNNKSRIRANTRLAMCNYLLTCHMHA